MWMYDTIDEENTIREIKKYFKKDYTEVILINPKDYDKINLSER